jgi:hypothetical protein
VREDDGGLSPAQEDRSNRRYGAYDDPFTARYPPRGAGGGCDQPLHLS